MPGPLDISNNGPLNISYPPNGVIGGTTADSSPTTKGVVQLVGDLGGAADAPTTPTAVHKTGTETIGGSKTFSSAIIPAGGVTPATAGFTSFGTGGFVNRLNATSGTAVGPVAGSVYWAAVFIPVNTLVTGLVYTVGAGSTGTDKVIAALYDSSGTLVASSALAGTTVTGATAKQQLPLTSPVTIVGPGVYYIALQFNGTAARFLTFNNTNEGFVTGSTTGTFGTLPTLVPGTSYNVNIGPYASTY